MKALLEIVVHVFELNIHDPLAMGEVQIRRVGPNNGDIAVHF